MPPRTCSSCGRSLSPGFTALRCERCSWWSSSNLGQWLTVGTVGTLEPETEGTARVDEVFDGERAPDLIEPVLAWRGWEVTPGGHLTASAVSGVWDPGANRAV